MQPPPSKHFPALDGLRGIAVLLVTVWHYIPFLPPFFPDWAGVDLFFVLSDYLITGQLMDAIGQPNYFSGFFRNRPLRVLPFYYSLVIPFLIAIRFVQEDHLPTIALYRNHWPGIPVFFQNWTLVTAGFTLLALFFTCILHLLLQPGTLSLLLSMISFYYFESFFLRLKTRKINA